MCDEVDAIEKDKQLGHFLAHLDMFSKNYFKIFFAAILLIGLYSTPGLAAGPIARSDILLHIVMQCLDPSLENYCSQCMSPRVEGHCGVTECKKTTDVWASNHQFMAMRDIKMCGCPSDFVHGLAIPRIVVRGVEDPKKPEAIWQFAWETALTKIEPESIALVVNPQAHRSQNQLHIHLLKLSSNAREKLAQNTPSFVDNLEHVWATASRAAAAKGLLDFGVLVSQTGAHQFMVVVTDFSPEAAFTQWTCN